MFALTLISIDSNDSITNYLQQTRVYTFQQFYHFFWKRLFSLKSEQKINFLSNRFEITFLNNDYQIIISFISFNEKYKKTILLTNISL